MVRGRICGGVCWLLSGRYSGFGKGKAWNMCESSREARKQTFAEYWLLNGHSLSGVVEGRSEGVEAEGVAYPADDGGWNCSRLLHGQWIFAVPCSFDGLGPLGLLSVALELTAAKSQCFFMNTGMSENARKR